MNAKMCLSMTDDFNNNNSPNKYIEAYNQYITNVLLCVSEIAIPTSEYKLYVKPFWKESSLSDFHSSMIKVEIIGKHWKTKRSN